MTCITVGAGAGVEVGVTCITVRAGDGVGLGKGSLMVCSIGKVSLSKGHTFIKKAPMNDPANAISNRIRIILFFLMFLIFDLFKKRLIGPFCNGFGIHPYIIVITGLFCDCF